MRVKILVVLLGLLASACSVPMREPAPVSIPSGDEPRRTPSAAVVELSRKAHQALAGQRYEQAATLLERAIGIEPRNPGLWHRLARVRYKQGNLGQAGQLAARSNALLNNAGSDLEAGNDRLIKAARKAGVF